MDILIRICFAVVVSFLISFIAAKVIIPLLRKAKAGQHVRDDGPQSHLVKEGTPTMGGLIMLVGIVVTTLIFSGFDRIAIFCVVTVLAFALIGFIDDALKLFKKRSLGLRAWQKIVMQFAFAAAVALVAYYVLGIDTLLIPGMIGAVGQTVSMGWGFIPFTMFVIIAMVNSVNLTDGLDGLATGITTINTVTILVLMFVVGVNNAAFPFVASVAGACIAFLFFNAHPAQVFMGDTGSFALGAALCAMTIVTGLQLYLPIMGLMFVLSSISVIIQVGSYKLRKKRVFKMAPLHHHFELAGNPETRVVSGYMIITMILSTICVLLSAM